MVSPDAEPGAPLDGVLVIDKPAGPTSHDMVAVARRALRLRRIGHTGTLDPLATGVLPLVVGTATRLSQFLTGASKGYRAHVRLGLATDTYDAQGRPLGEPRPDAAAAVDDASLAAALEAFRGEIAQAPPPYSAKKIGGVRAYDLARRDVDVAPAPVRVTVHHLELLERQGADLTVRVEASAGFYVRSLAHELGARLGCGGHLVALQRYRSGAFTLAQAVTLDALQQAPQEAIRRMVPMAELLPDLPAFDLTETGARRARHGNPLGPSDGRPREGRVPPPGVACRLFTADGRLLGIARRGDGGALQPVIVLG